MPGPADILRELHRLRRHAKGLSDELERLPKQLDGLHNKAKRQEDALRKCQEGIKQLKVKMHEKEVSIKSTLAQIGKLETQCNEASGKKEYDAFQSEIALTRVNWRKLEDEAFEA